MTNRRKRIGSENELRARKRSSPASSTKNELEQESAGKGKRESAQTNIPKTGKRDVGKRGSGGQLH